MADPSIVRDMKAVRNLINQADMALDTIPPSLKSARESVKSALMLSADLAKRLSAEAVNLNAAALGARGGTKTAERGPAYYKRISAMRKTKAGGRPRKEPL